MELLRPEEFSRSFAKCWSARDLDALVALFAADADFHSLSGVWCEGRDEISATLGSELAGVFARARLVTGKTRNRALGPHAAVVHQRFVLSGLIDAEGRDMGRIGAVLSATLSATESGWQVVCAHFTAEA